MTADQTVASADPITETDGQALSLRRRAYNRWMRIAHAIGVVQTRIVMFLFYFVFVLPLGLVARLLRDPLHIKYPDGGNWVAHPQTPHSIETAQRQF